MVTNRTDIDPKKLLLASCLLLYLVLAGFFNRSYKYIPTGGLNRGIFVFILPLVIVLILFYKMKGNEKKLGEFVKSHTLEIQYVAFGLWTLVLLHLVSLGVHKTDIVAFWVLGVPLWFFILSLVVKARNFNLEKYENQDRDNKL